MILTAHSLADLDVVFRRIGMEEALRSASSMALKINLSSPPKVGHPRTDSDLIALLVDYAERLGVTTTIVEGADGHLEKNLRIVGLGEWLDEGRMACVDIDGAAVKAVRVPDGEMHYLPECLLDFEVRVALPVTSRRPNETFSNNVKLFVGIVPRRYYQDGTLGVPRPRIHADFHRSVANLYRAVQRFAPFHFFVNGGPLAVEGSSLDSLGKYLVSDDGLELDRYVLGELGLEVPAYIERLVTPKRDGDGSEPRASPSLLHDATKEPN
jgi:uncharacterized protein (DUF362 family)